MNASMMPAMDAAQSIAVRERHSDFFVHGTVARQELVKNELMQDAANVLVDAEHQLQRGTDGDDVVASTVGSDDVVINQNCLVQMCNPDGVDDRSWL